MNVETCPVCESSDLYTFVERPSVPVHQNLVMRTATEARSLVRGRLEMRCCHRCSFAFNAAFDERLLGYGEHYDNTQANSPAFRAYMDDLVSQLVERRGVRAARIVEVGCGKGHFIRALVERAAENVGWGFDPSYEGELTACEGRLEFRRQFYGPGCEELRADVVVCRHVIEHVADPVGLLSTVNAALISSTRPRIFFETPSLEWILRNRVVWDFFYEHCSLFSRASLASAVERAGFSNPQVTEIFGDQYIWLEADIDRSAPSPARFEPGAILELAKAYRADETRWFSRWHTRIAELGSSTKLAIWGAGAKGVTFANLIDPECRRIECVVDLNPNKQGCFVPGTGHPIVAPVELAKRGVDVAIVMNPNYRTEIEAELAALEAHLRLIE